MHGLSPMPPVTGTKQSRLLTQALFPLSGGLSRPVLSTVAQAPDTEMHRPGWV